MEKKLIEGTTTIMKNRMRATVIADRNALDIDVLFEDGTVVEHARRDERLSQCLEVLGKGKKHQFGVSQQQSSRISGQGRLSRRSQKVF